MVDAEILVDPRSCEGVREGTILLDITRVEERRGCWALERSQSAFDRDAALVRCHWDHHRLSLSDSMVDWGWILVVVGPLHRVVDANHHRDVLRRELRDQSEVVA